MNNHHVSYVHVDILHQQLHNKFVLSVMLVMLLSFSEDFFSFDSNAQFLIIALKIFSFYFFLFHHSFLSFFYHFSVLSFQ